MKTLNAQIRQERKTRSFVTGRLIPALASNLHHFMAVIYAGLAAAVVITLSIWVIGMSMSWPGAGLCAGDSGQYLQPVFRRFRIRFLQ